MSSILEESTGIILNEKTILKEQFIEGLKGCGALS